MKSLLSLNRFLWRYKWRLLIGVLFVVGGNLFQVFSVNYVGKGTDLIEENLPYKMEITKLESKLDSLRVAPIKHKSQIQTIETKISELDEKWKEARSPLIFATLLIIGFALLGSVFKFGMRQMIIVASRLIEFDLKNDIYQQYQKLSLSFYKKNQTGDLMNRITEDVSHVRMYLGPGLMYPINLISLIVILITIMLQQDAQLTLYTLAPLPFLSFLIYKVANVINKKSNVLQEKQSDLSSFVQDSFSGIRVIKSYNIGNQIESSYQEEAEEYQRRAISLAQTQAFFFPLMILIVGISYVSILYFGGLRYINGDIKNIGVIVKFFIYLNMLIWPFTALGWVTMIVQRAEASMKRINEFLQEEPQIQNLEKKKREIHGKIEYKNVSFVYENTGIKALDKVSFQINQGETLAILGKTGSGKSTLISLLTRLFDPTEGEIELDGLGIKSHNLYQLRRSIGFVPQEAFLFSDTVENNLLFGVDSESNHLATEYAKKAAVHKNIEKFADGYKTRVGERGVTLSGGQKQRISIARALVTQPQILVFDDSLSAVDTETEEEILQNLEAETKNRTTIIVTHRVSSAKNADLILVLDEGKVIEKGNHFKLLNQKGFYAELHHKQLNG